MPLPALSLFEIPIAYICDNLDIALDNITCLLGANPRLPSMLLACVMLINPTQLDY